MKTFTCQRPKSKNDLLMLLKAFCRRLLIVADLKTLSKRFLNVGDAVCFQRRWKSRDYVIPLNVPFFFQISSYFFYIHYFADTQYTLCTFMLLKRLTIPPSRIFNRNLLTIQSVWMKVWLQPGPWTYWNLLHTLLYSKLYLPVIKFYRHEIRVKGCRFKYG